MKKTITSLLFCLGICAVHAQNNCNTAVTVTPGIHNVTFSAGSQIPPGNCIGTNNAGGRATWFKYTPTENHNATITTDITGYPNLDTRVQIYSGSCANLICVAGDDDSGGNNSSFVTFGAMAGTTYYIVFDDRWWGGNSTFQLIEAPYMEPQFTSGVVNLSGSYKLGVVDMNGDYLDDIVSVSNGVVNILYQNSDGNGFTEAVRTTPGAQNLPSWSLAAGDFDKNGYNDLLCGDQSGASILLASDDGTSFNNMIESESSFYLFSQRTNFVDINNDGNLDAFVCHDVQPNVYFLNNGEGGFTFHQGGLGDYPSGGNYGSIWIDYDNDGDVDLFIAKCRGGGDQAGINELHKNNGDGTYTQIAGAAYPENNMSDIIQTWSSAWADYDNDGDMDVLVGASSSTQGSHKLMVNNGDGTFTNGTAGTGFDSFPHLNIEHIAHDFNNDGWVDVYGGGQQIMYNNGDMTFSPNGIPAENGPIGDLNNDGFLDIFNGYNNTVYYGVPSENNWIKVHLEGVESNRNGIGARVEVYAAGDGWSKQIRDVRSGDGFEFMSSLNTHFGLGETNEIEKVVVKWPSGVVDTYYNPDVNTALFSLEGETALNTEEVNNNLFTVYPNPVKDVLNIGGNNEISKITVFDIAGRTVKNIDVVDGKASLQSLAKGTYILKLHGAQGKVYSSKIVKE